MREVARSFHRKALGNGRKTSFWFDSWFDRGALIHILGERGFVDLGIRRDATVEEAFMISRRRTRHRSPVLIEIEAELMRVKQRLRQDVEDVSLWRQKAGFKEKFSTHETWSLLRRVGEHCAWSKGIWFPQATPKYAFVTWLAARNRLSTMDRVSNWTQGVDEVCVLCKTEMETRSHLFFSCSYSSQVWEFLTKGILGDDYSSDWSAIIAIVADGRFEKKKQFCLPYAFQASVHAIWRERNRIRHEEKPKPIAVVKKLVDKGIRNKLSLLRTRD
ncbi:uncharacterized protein LOC108829831 [Raphanus sativus]|uniref:Uncharacterized protein LOC108829831 n=1 Tax=Raphanus sativus TaxID=3726 RepID=A0A6J0LGC9_RAPSA|nr:uncharacterized protein LOC108829831 [Raphanus sativus]